ncbi:hypothetical protein [Grimontia hollisae]|nr:hypothetical protein [Grimontia hollisae]
MNVIAVKADADLSGRNVDPEDYQRLKTIAMTAASELNAKKETR